MIFLIACFEGEILNSICNGSNLENCDLNQKRFCSPIIWVTPTLFFSYLICKTADLRKKQKLVYMASKLKKFSLHKNTLSPKNFLKAPLASKKISFEGGVLKCSNYTKLVSQRILMF